MKKTVLTTIILLITLSINAQEWVGINRDATRQIQETLISSSENKIVVDVEISGFYKETVNTPQGEQLVISGDDMAYMPIKGVPNLPMYPISMIIGDDAEMKVAVVKSKYVDFENVEVAPSKGDFSRKINPDDVPYTYGEMYQQDAFYPAQQATLGNPYILRDFRGQNVMVYPYAYNPVTKTLRVYTYLRIEAKKISDEGMNAKVRTRNKKVNPEVNTLYKHRFINYPTNDKRYTFMEEEGEMLIICTDKYVDAVKPLVEWKNISGRPTKMVPLSETGNSLKGYIIDYYETNPDFVYLLLVGEHEDIPSYPMSGGESDVFYGMLEGDDSYEEVMVGRLSVKSLEDAKNQVNKIIYYERDVKTTATWLSRAAGISANEGDGEGHYGESDYKHIDFIRDTLLNYTYTEVSQHYANVNNPTAEKISADFNKGVGLINYCNHGYYDSWLVTDYSVEDVHNLTNDNKLPIVWSVACNNGQIEYDECFGEAWMRATNPKTGAFTGAVGGMFSWISQPWLPPMYGQDEMVAILTEWREGYKHTLGGASCNGSMFMMDMDPFNGEDTHNTWFLLGDPSMMVRTKKPTSLSVELPQQDLFIGMTSLNVKVDADYALATLSLDGEVIASAKVEDGAANLVFEPLVKEGTAKLVVIGYNKVTEIKEMRIVPNDNSYLIYAGYEILDDNKQLDYCETANLSLKIKNVGKKPTSNVAVRLASDSRFVTILDDNAEISSIASGEVISLENAFTVSVKPHTPNGTKINFNLICSDDNEEWVTTFFINANAPVFNITDIEVISDALLMPGDTAALKIQCENNGKATAYDVLVETFAPSSELTFDSTAILVDELAAGKSLSVTTKFVVAESVKKGTVFDVICAANADYATASKSLEIKVGEIGDDFETGDFSSHPWKVQGMANWIVSDIESYEGNYCATTDVMENNQYAKLRVQIDVMADGPLTFYVKTSTELDFDKMEFYINSKLKHNWSGEMDWKKITIDMKKGTYTLEWRYKKDSAGSEGDDRVYLDKIVFPPVCSVTMIESVSGLRYDVMEGQLKLSWQPVEDAKEYIVRRDGDIVSAQTETEYYENNFGEEIVTYSITAKNGENCSAPKFIIVDPNREFGENIIKIETQKVSLYPNPTSGMLFTELENTFDAVVYNYQGQVVMRVDDAYGKIDLSQLTKGVYFVEMRQTDKVTIEKIILK